MIDFVQIWKLLSTRTQATRTPQLHNPPIHQPYSKHYLVIFGCIFIFLTSICKFASANENNNIKISVIVIDAGHGGKDLGASFQGVQEKDIALRLALKLGKLIQIHYPHIKVIYTRTKDTFIPLNERAEVANTNCADLFISLHANYSKADWVQGAETFIYGNHDTYENRKVAQKENSAILFEDNYSSCYDTIDFYSEVNNIMSKEARKIQQQQSILIATCVQNQFREYAKRQDRSVKKAPFLVLGQVMMPGVLIETGFLSHPIERMFLADSLGQNKLAQAIFYGFQNYKNLLENTEASDSSEHQLTSHDPHKTKQKQQLISSEKENSAIKDTLKNSIKHLSKPMNPNIHNQVYFSVQIMALKRNLPPTPEYFKGELLIFKIEFPEINRYFSGKFASLQEAGVEKERLANIFKNAFVVAIKDNELISIKKALEGR